MRAASSSSSSSLSTKATIAPAEKRTKVLGQRYKQTAKGQSILICSPKSMLATTGVPRRVLDWWDFLAVDGAEEELSARPLFPKVRGARGTRWGTYSSYTSENVEETPRSIMVVWNLLIKDAPARLPLASTFAGRSSRGIGSAKLRPNSYKRVKQQDKED